jgi:hypothetical protein
MHAEALIVPFVLGVSIDVTAATVPETFSPFAPSLKTPGNVPPVEVEYLFPLASNSEPKIETFPGNVVVAPLFPIVIPVAVDVPMEMVPAPSITTLPSPEIVVPLKLSDAKATETPPTRVTTMATDMMSGSFCFTRLYMGLIYILF